MLRSFLQRLTEPSTHAGLAVAAQILKGFNPGLGLVFDVVSGAFVSLAVGLSEKK